MNSVSKYLIYVLVDPRDGAWRYIGKSCSGLKRPKQHSQENNLQKCSNLYKVNWIRQLQSFGLSPAIEIIEELPSQDFLSDAEQSWIAEAKRQGVRLVNLTEGGEGMVGNVRSEETRKKISQAKFGNKHALGQVRSDETRNKMALAHGAKPFMDVCCGKVYGTLWELKRDYPWINRSHVSYCLNGRYRYKSTGGHTFKYLEATNA